jgi:hypothetical protein
MTRRLFPVRKESVAYPVKMGPRTAKLCFEIQEGESKGMAGEDLHGNLHRIGFPVFSTTVFFSRCP